MSALHPVYRLMDADGREFTVQAAIGLDDEVAAIVQINDEVLVLGSGDVLRLVAVLTECATVHDRVVGDIEVTVSEVSA